MHCVNARFTDSGEPGDQADAVLVNSCHPASNTRNLSFDEKVIEQTDRDLAVW